MITNAAKRVKVGSEFALRQLFVLFNYCFLRIDRTKDLVFSEFWPKFQP